ncbi:MAG: hypothetical protein ACOC3Z_01705 [Nanoarchaeota archaeon]
MKKSKKPIKKEVAFRDNIIAIEDLPFPIIHYPGFYGAFFGFRKNEKSNIFFCSCVKEAIENYIKLKIKYPSQENANLNRNYILDSMYFPYEIVRKLIKQKIPNNEKVIKFLKFENKLCHECNKATPSYKYCHEMYGGVFKQTYGWYINKKSYEFGISGILALEVNYLKDRCPEELINFLEEASKLVKERNILQRKEGSSTKYFQIESNLNKILRKINNIIENEVRVKFGHKKVGEAWTSETILYYMIQKLYPNMTILRHFRTSFLDYLELDVYIKELNIGIEYQGLQHFRPVKHWGGEFALKKTKERDKKKKELCEKEGIKLIYFYYDEDLSEDIIKERIES